MPKPNQDVYIVRSSINIKSGFTSNFSTRWGRNWIILRTKKNSHKQSNVVYAVQTSQGSTICTSWRQNNHWHLREKNHSFEDNSVNIHAREDRWFERRVKESISVKLKWPTLNRGGGLRHYLRTSPTHTAVLSSLLSLLNYHSHMGSPRNPPEGQISQHSQVALTNVKLLTKDISTQDFKPATCLQLVETEEASWIRGEMSTWNWNIS